MIKCVIDGNYLRSEKLREYLARSPKNIAVLSDYSAMEAHWRETLTTIFKSKQTTGAIFLWGTLERDLL
jgi:hypothetical protein